MSCLQNTPHPVSRCGNRATFQLGSRYSELLDVGFRSDQGKKSPFFMGTYRIFPALLAACVVEQDHDENGIVWSPIISPFHVHLVAINIEKQLIREVSEKIYKQLTESGFEVLFDDRPGVSPGVKFKDADLIGIPYRINVGRTAENGNVELVERKTGNREIISLDSIKNKTHHLYPWI